MQCVFFLFLTLKNNFCFVWSQKKYLFGASEAIDGATVKSKLLKFFFFSKWASVEHSPFSLVVKRVNHRVGESFCFSEASTCHSSTIEMHCRSHFEP